MELAETIDTINRQLREEFGIETESNNPMYRVVWSMDQYEKRMMDYDDHGGKLLFPKVRMVPKYKQWIVDRYVLESLVIIPEINEHELVSTKKSYEPLFVFQNAYDGEYLPPRFDAAKFVIDAVLAAKGVKSMAKYVDDEASNPDESKRARVDKLQNELFGDASGLMGKTLTGSAVVVPHNYTKEN